MTVAVSPKTTLVITSVELDEAEEEGMLRGQLVQCEGAERGDSRMYGAMKRP